MMTALSRLPRDLSDYAVTELLAGQSLLAGEGIKGRAFEIAWRQHADALVELWISGRKPPVKFVIFKPGKQCTRPPGWWRFCAPRPRRKGESQLKYLEAEGLLLPGEREQVHAAHRASKG